MVGANTADAAPDRPTIEPTVSPTIEPIANPSITRCVEIAAYGPSRPRCDRSTPAATTAAGDGSRYEGTTPDAEIPHHAARISSGSTPPSNTRRARLGAREGGDESVPALDEPKDDP